MTDLLVHESSDLSDETSCLVSIGEKFMVVTREMIAPLRMFVELNGDRERFRSDAITHLDLSEDDVKKILKEIPEDLLVKRVSRVVASRRGFLLRMEILAEKSTNAISRPFSYLFNRYFALSALLATAFLLWNSWRDIAYYAVQPNKAGPISVVLGIYLLSILFHELGHASALKRASGRPKGIGIGLYYIFPAFYTDVTDSWAMPRMQRVIVGMGGIYFQLIFVLPILSLSIWYPAGFLYFAVFLILFGTLFALNPIFKLDGYWVMTDLLGVTDLRAWIVDHLFAFSLSREFWKPLVAWFYMAAAGATLAFVFFILKGTALSYWEYVNETWNLISAEGVSIHSMSALFFSILWTGWVLLLSLAVTFMGRRILSQLSTSMKRTASDGV